MTGRVAVDSQSSHKRSFGQSTGRRFKRKTSAICHSAAAVPVFTRLWSSKKSAFPKPYCLRFLRSPVAKSRFAMQSQYSGNTIKMHSQLQSNANRCNTWNAHLIKTIAVEPIIAAELIITFQNGFCASISAQSSARRRPVLTFPMLICGQSS